MTLSRETVAEKTQTEPSFPRDYIPSMGYFAEFLSDAARESADLPFRVRVADEDENPVEIVIDDTKPSGTTVELQFANFRREMKITEGFIYYTLEINDFKNGMGRRPFKKGLGQWQFPQGSTNPRNGHFTSVPDSGNAPLRIWNEAMYRRLGDAAARDYEFLKTSLLQLKGMLETANIQRIPSLI